MKAGAATVTINNDIGTLIQGAGDPNQRVECIKDDLEANALFLETDSTQLLLISCDLAVLETDRVTKMAEAIASRTGLPSHAVLIGCSHTHSGPVVLRTNYQKPIDEAYSARLQESLCDLAADAVNNAGPALVGWGMGNARLGYNRRVCYSDGTHSMYRAAGRHDAFTGIEGPDDTACMALAVFDDENHILAVLHHGTGHADTFYGQQFLSADYPGVARRLVREAHGAIPVLFFNGALGDIGMVQQMHPQVTPGGRTARMIGFGSALAGETLRLIHEMRPQRHVLLQHIHQTLELPVRLPTTEAVERGRATLARMDAGEKVTGREAIFAWGPVSLAEQFGDNPVDRLPFHALRIGDLAIVTNPFELFCQYQLDIKRRSPASDTVCFGLTGGFGGYLPTPAAVRGGGYSGEPFAWARFAPDVGYLVTDTLADMVRTLLSHDQTKQSAI